MLLVLLLVMALPVMAVMAVLVMVPVFPPPLLSSRSAALECCETGDGPMDGLFEAPVFTCSCVGSVGLVSAQRVGWGRVSRSVVVG